VGQARTSGSVRALWAAWRRVELLYESLIKSSIDCVISIALLIGAYRGLLGRGRGENSAAMIDVGEVVGRVGLVSRRGKRGYRGEEALIAAQRKIRGRTNYHDHAVRTL